MTVNTFKQKAPTIQAIEVTNILSQAEEVANLIGSEAYQIKMKNEARSIAEGSFVAKDGATVLVKEGQVVSWIDGVTTVLDAKDFYAQYETV